MPEEILFATEQRMDREQIAAYLRDVADHLAADGDLTLASGEDSVSLSVPAQPTFEVKVERETNGGPAEQSVEFELEWDEGDDGGREELRIE